MTGERVGRSAAVFAMLRSWGAGIVVLWVVTALLGVTVFERYGTVERMGSLGWRILLLHVPTAVAALLSAYFAARVHPEPFRSSPAQHLFAALAVPLGAQLFALARHWGVLVPQGVVLSSLAVVAGCLTGTVADVMRDRTS